MKSVCIALSTRDRVQLIDITRRVEEVVRQSGIDEGLCVVFVPHTTAGVTINENADPDVVADMIQTVNKTVPFQDHYRHGEGNSAAHIKSSLFGPSLTLLVASGGLVLGTWQGIYFAEFDGPRSRTFYVKVLSG
ncbi:MAG TPA: secondary thiamine-phosphate synthase enzyme YjbQ [bacterium]|nr:secondary thiamine-phosphate synthase enzyme YjbQ [bacterium]HPN33830.1 secondary thiamine-phosphate synthase enzyme YjbQ [bacterium]